MKLNIFFTAMIVIESFNAIPQQFISKAMIEYEVKSNIKKTMGNNSFEEMIKDNLPTFKTAYYTFTFADNKSIYKFDHWNELEKIPDFLKRGEEDNAWYYDYTSEQSTIQKNIFGTNLTLRDSIPALQWKLTNENREIAGFNCRKAIAKIFDSVYVYAFYTDEILISGGPVSINGLPGMILGVTIPRLFTSWIATKVIVNNVPESTIKPAVSKKNYTMNFLKSTVDERLKDWTTDDPEEKQQKDRFVWQILL